MTHHTFVEMLFTVAVATMAGGLTDTVSIFLLFRPYEPKGIGRFTIQGALPKNKARLARSIARTVGERLLTPEDLAARLNTPAIRATFDDAISRMFDGLLERERGSLRSHFTPAVHDVVERAVAGLAPQLAERLGGYVRSEAGHRQLEVWIDQLRAQVQDRPLSQGLTPERQTALRARLATLIDQVADSPELERALRQLVDTQVRQLAGDERPLLGRLPAGVVGALEQGIADYIPMALERLAGLLSDPEARERIEVALRSAFDHSVRDLLLHERILAKLVVTDRTIERLVDGFEREGFERFTEAISAPEMRERLARAVRDAVVGFLLVPTSERLRALGDERRDAAAAAFADWLVGVVHDPGTRHAVTGIADRAIEALDRRTWGDVFAAIPPAQMAELAAGAVGGEEGRRAVEAAVRGLADRLLEQPIGRPAAWLGADATATLRREMSRVSWAWIETQIPLVVQQIRVEEIIEQKVNALPIQRVEQIIRDVSQRELDLIIRVGYVLGGLFGLCAFWLGRLVGL